MPNERKETKQITIVDIAKAAGTSPATVSRVLNGSPHRIDPEVRERVLATVQSLGYSPNPFGRMLKTSELQEIAVILPTLQNPFYIEMLSGIEHAARKNGYDVIVFNSYHRLESEQQHIRSVMAKRIRALVIAFVSDETAHLAPFLSAGGKAALIDQHAETRENCISVAVDCTQGLDEAVAYLVSLGHRHIAYATLPLTRRPRQHQFDTFRAVCKKHGIALDEADILVSAQTDRPEDHFFEYMGGRDIGRQLLARENRPTAIIANNDIVAIGCMNTLQEAGVRVPRDLSVIGVDGIAFSRMVSPPLTTVRAHAFEMGESACVRLMERIADKPPFAPMQLCFDTKLQLGSSSAAPNGDAVQSGTRAAEEVKRD